MREYWMLPWLAGLRPSSTLRGCSVDCAERAQQNIVRNSCNAKEARLNFSWKQEKASRGKRSGEGISFKSPNLRPGDAPLGDRPRLSERIHGRLARRVLASRRVGKFSTPFSLH